MRRYIAIPLIFLSSVCLADTVWDSGHHEILDGETYQEIWMYNDATADMWGGDVFQLGALGTSRFNMRGGTMDYLMARYNSVVNIYGGNIDIALGLEEDSKVYIHAYDVIFHYTPGYNDRGWIEGWYIANSEYFTVDYAAYDNSQVSIVPEPGTFFLLGLGSIILKKKR